MCLSHSYGPAAFSLSVPAESLNFTFVFAIGPRGEEKPLKALQLKRALRKDLIF